MLKIIGIAFVGVVLYQILRNTKSDFAIFVSISVGVVILVLLSDKISQVVNVFNDLSVKAGLSSEIFSSIIKIIGIGYLTEYSVNLCDDAGCSGIGKKIELCGKITILIMALPIINGIITIIGELL